MLKALHNWNERKDIQRHATSIFIRTIITLYSKMMKRGNCKLNTNHSLQMYSIIICRVRVLRFKFRHSAQSHQHTTHITVRYVRRVYLNIHTQLPSFTGIIFKCVENKSEPFLWGTGANSVCAPIDATATRQKPEYIWRVSVCNALVVCNRRLTQGWNFSSIYFQNINQLNW